MDLGRLYRGAGVFVRTLRIGSARMGTASTKGALQRLVLVKNPLKLFGVFGLGESDGQKDTRFLWIKGVRNDEIALVVVHLIISSNDPAPCSRAAHDQDPFGAGIRQRLFRQLRRIPIADSRIDDSVDTAGRECINRSPRNI